MGGSPSYVKNLVIFCQYMPLQRKMFWQCELQLNSIYFSIPMGVNIRNTKLNFANISLKLWEKLRKTVEVNFAVQLPIGLTAIFASVDLQFDVLLMQEENKVENLLKAGKEILITNINYLLYIRHHAKGFSMHMHVCAISQEVSIVIFSIYM